MTKSCIKRIIYMLLTTALMLIDWTRGSQVGSTWAWTVNMMGVVIALMLITADGIKEFCKVKYLIISLISVCMLPAGYYWWTLNQQLIYRDKLLSAICNVWFLGICLIRLLEKEFQKGIYRKRPKMLVLLADLLFLIMYISVNEDIWPIWFFVIFTIVYSWRFNTEEKRLIINGLIDGIIVSFFILQGMAFVFRPFDTEHKRYCGIYSNPNMNALFYCIVLLAFAIRLFQLRKNGKPLYQRIICFLFMASTAAFATMTVSKTAWIAIILCVLLYIMVVDFRILQKKAKWVLSRIALYVLVMALSLPIVYLPIRYLPPVFHHPIWYEGEYAEWKVHSWDPWNSDKYVSFGEVMGAVSGRLRPIAEKLFSEKTVSMGKAYAEEIRDVNGIHVGPYFFAFDDEDTLKYSSYLGRAATWYYYFFNGDLLGHSNSEGHYTGMGATYNWHAQNVFLQIWYYYGIPAGILFLVVSIGAWITSVRRAWKAEIQHTDEAVVVALYLTLFLTFGLFEAVWYPGQMILTLAVFSPKLMLEEETMLK